MKIKPFLVEEWMNAYENDAKINIAETCVNSIALEELFEIANMDLVEFFKDFASRRQTYGHIEGNPKFLDGICNQYKDMKPENIITTHGAIGANHHVFFSLVEPGDEVISVMPTYQQLYSIPEAYGADLKIMHLKKENNYLPDIEELKNLVTENTKLICINNPNNPTGALIPKEMMLEIVEIAKNVGAYILCDEVYRNLSQDGNAQESIVDLYDKGISVSSMSKIFSLAGIRLGWIATKDEDALKSFWIHRDYNHISCSMFDEEIGGIALSIYDKLLNRSKEIVQNNLKVLDDWINSQEHFSYVKPKAGTTALVHYDFDKPSYEFCKELLEETGDFVTPGACFEIENSFRVGYAADKSDLIKGLKAIEEFSKKLVVK